MEVKIKNCEDCGAEIVYKTSRKQYCKDCLAKRATERRLALKKYRSCSMCGVPLGEVSRNVRLCPECRVAAKAKKQADKTEEIQNALQEYVGYVSTSKPKLDMDEMLFLARYWKLTYGYAVAKVATVSDAEINAILQKRPKKRKKKRM